MTDFFNKIWNTFKEHVWLPGNNEFFGLLMYGSLTFVLYLIIKSIIKSFKLFDRFRERQIVIPRLFIKYKKSLDEETLRLNHSWKLEGQSLKELIVPVMVIGNNKSDRLNLEGFIKEQFSSKKEIKFVLLGDAGSGKSVAMGLIARKIWEIDKDNIIFPVLLTFSDIKNVRTENAFETIIIQNIERHQFGTGKRNHKAKNFVEQNLYEGHILLLIDGMDELEKSIRIETTNFLNKFFQTNTKIPFIISSRLAVWKQNTNVLHSLSFETIYIADFTPFEIQQFVSQWNFIGSKSPGQLSELINNKVYLKSISVNPLLLTILCFIYAQPKRVLPDNRVKFYTECIDALMEKWDNAKLLDKANQFETIDKITILSRLAYEHIVNAKTTDEDIFKTDVLRIVGEVMKDASRPIEKRESMLNEIVQNAELLVELPPDAYKFPHRTFMEYFAANYFFEKNKHLELLKLYESDKGKWQETLALFCGLNVHVEISDTILNKLLSDFISTKHKEQPDTFVFRILVESSRISPSIATEILEISKLYLSKKINRDITEQLGHIAINPNWSHSQFAKDILINLLANKLTDDDLQTVILSLAYLKDPHIEKIILSHLDKINLKEFIIRNGSEKFIIKLFDVIPKNRLEELFSALLESNKIELLFSLMVDSSIKEVRQHAAWALCLTSKSNNFFDLLDSIKLKELDPTTSNIIDKKFNYYTWSKPNPKSKIAQKYVFLICILASEFIIENDFNDSIIKKQYNIHNWLRYLISAFIFEINNNFSKYNIIGIPIRGCNYGIKYHWINNKRHKGDRVLIYGLLLYPIVNCFFLIFYWVSSYYLMKIILFSLIGFVISCFLIIQLKKNKKDKEKINKIIIVFFILSFPFFLLSRNTFHLLFPNKIKMMYTPIFFLILGVIISIIYLILPLPFIYKIINLTLTSIYTFIVITSGYLSPLSFVIPNPYVMNFIEDPSMPEFYRRLD